LSTRNLSDGKGQPARKADLTAIGESIVWKMWEPRRLTTLWASTVCYRDSFTFNMCRLSNLTSEVKLKSESKENTDPVLN
jgi:hypothetical protein